MFDNDTRDNDTDGETDGDARDRVTDCDDVRDCERDADGKFECEVDCDSKRDGEREGEGDCVALVVLEILPARLRGAAECGNAAIGAVAAAPVPPGSRPILRLHGGNLF